MYRPATIDILRTDIAEQAVGCGAQRVRCGSELPRLVFTNSPVSSSGPQLALHAVPTRLRQATKHCYGLWHQVQRYSEALRVVFCRGQHWLLIRRQGVKSAMKAER